MRVNVRFKVLRVFESKNGGKTRLNGQIQDGDKGDYSDVIVMKGVNTAGVGDIVTVNGNLGVTAYMGKSKDGGDDVPVGKFIIFADSIQLGHGTNIDQDIPF